MNGLCNTLKGVSIAALIGLSGRVSSQSVQEGNWKLKQPLMIKTAISTQSADSDNVINGQIRQLSHETVLSILPRLLISAPNAAFAIPMIPPLSSWGGNRISSTYGWRKHPVKGKLKFHEGIDLAGPPQWVRASGSGWVEKTGYDPSLGNYVWIDHGNSYRTLYGHLTAISVMAGQRLSIGDRVGILGKTGNATGYHLHYAIKKNSRYINPAPYLIAAYKVLESFEIQL